MDFYGNASNDEDVEVDIEGLEDSHLPARNLSGHQSFCSLSIAEAVFLPTDSVEVLHQKPSVTCSEEPSPLNLDLSLSGQYKKKTVRKRMERGKTEVSGRRTTEEIRRSLDLDFGSFLSRSFVKTIQEKKENSDEVAMEKDLETHKESLTRSCKDLEQKMKELEKQIKLKQAILRDDRPGQSPSDDVVQAEGHEGQEEDVEEDGSLTESIVQIERKEQNGEDIRCSGQTEGLQPLFSKPASYFMSRVVLSCAYVLNKVPLGTLSCDSETNALYHQLESTWKSFDWKPPSRSETQAAMDVLKEFASVLTSEVNLSEKDNQSKVPVTRFQMCEKQHSSQLFTVSRRKETTLHADHVDSEGQQGAGVRQKIFVNRKNDKPAASCTFCDFDEATIQEVNSGTFSVNPVIEQSVRRSGIYEKNISAGLTADAEGSDMSGKGKRTRCETEAVRTKVDDPRIYKKARVESTMDVQEQENGDHVKEEMIVDKHNVEDLKMNDTHKIAAVNVGGQLLESGNNVCKTEQGKSAVLAGEEEEDYLELGDDDSIEMGDTESRLADDWEIHHNSKEEPEVHNGESEDKRSRCEVEKLGLCPSSLLLSAVKKGGYQQQGTENGFASAYSVAHVGDFNANIVPHFAIKSVSAGLSSVTAMEGPNVIKEHVMIDCKNEFIGKVEPVVDNAVKCSEYVAQEMEKRSWTEDNKTKQEQRSQPDLEKAESRKGTEVFLRQTAGKGSSQKTVRTLNSPRGEPLGVLRKRLEENIQSCTEQRPSKFNLNSTASLSSGKDRELAFQSASFSGRRAEEDSTIDKKHSSVHAKQGRARLLAKHPEKPSRNITVAENVLGKDHTSLEDLKLTRSVSDNFHGSMGLGRNLEASFENRKALRNTLYADNCEPNNRMRAPELLLDPTAGLRGRSDRKCIGDVEDGEIANGFAGNKGEKYTEYALKSGRIVTELIKDEVSTDIAKRYAKTIDYRTDPGKKFNKSGADGVVIPPALRIRIPEVTQSEKRGVIEQTDRSMQNGRSKFVNSGKVKGVNGSILRASSRETSENLPSPSGKSSVREFEGEAHSNTGKKTDLAYGNQAAKPAKAGGCIAGGTASTSSNGEKYYEGEVGLKDNVGIAAPSPKLVVKILKKKPDPGKTEAIGIEDKRGGGHGSNSEGEVKLNKAVRGRLKSQTEGSKFRDGGKSAMTVRINESSIVSGRGCSTFSEHETRTIQEMVSTVIICTIDSKRANESGNWSELDSKLRDALKDMLDSKTWNVSKQKNTRFGLLADSVKKWALGPAPPRIPRWLQEKLDDLYSLDTYDEIEGIPGNLDRLQQIYQTRYKGLKHVNELWRTFHSKLLHRERSRSLSPNRHGFQQQP